MEDLVELVTKASLELELVIKEIDLQTEYQFHDELYQAQYALEVASNKLAKERK